MKTFRRLSAPGSSALSIWRLRAREEDCTALFGQRLPLLQKSFSLDRQSLPFDEALLWRRSNNKDAAVVECHLHGGYGVAAAFRAWMHAAGWKEETRNDCGAQEDSFCHANSPLAARVYAAQRKHAFAGEMQRLTRLPLPERVVSIARIQQWNAWAEVLDSPPCIALAGPPNVGKSSLFNLWNRAALATTQDGSGTTRDAVEVPLLLGTAHEQALFTLSDTAGIGEGLSVLDQAAMAMALEQVASAWMVIWVLDQNIPPNDAVIRAMGLRKARDLVVLNRNDLEATWNPSALGLVPDLSGHVALGPAWISALEACILGRLGAAPPPGALVAVKKSQRDQLEALLHRCS